MDEATFIDLMPKFREQARENPRFKVTDDGAITINTDYYKWTEDEGSEDTAPESILGAQHVSNGARRED